MVVHADECDGYTAGVVPPEFETRRQIVRPYTTDHRIAYDLVRLVEPEESLTTAIHDVFAHTDVESALVRNVLAGCLSFEVRRAVTQ